MRSLSERWSRARNVNHCCNCCGNTIYVSEKYHRIAVLEGTTVTNYREHVPCALTVQMVMSFEINTYDRMVRPVLSDFSEAELSALLEADAGLWGDLHDIILREGDEEDEEQSGRYLLPMR